MDTGTERKLFKLHLGCGDKYLQGYVNIDFPQTEHTVMHPKADLFADIRTLNYAEGSVDEIRSHHMFEHFSRPAALALLLTWRKWLRPGGTLVIETPDFRVSAREYLRTTSMRRSFQLWRHILGSQEAGWATHGDYWDQRKFRFVLNRTGFGSITTRSYWHGISKHAKDLPILGKFLQNLPEPLYLLPLNLLGLFVPHSVYEKHGGNAMPSVLATAKKTDSPIDDEAVAREILSMSLVGKERDEMLNVWLGEYRDFIHNLRKAE